MTEPVIVHVVFQDPDQMQTVQWGPFFSMRLAQEAVANLAMRSDVRQAYIAIPEKTKPPDWVGMLRPKEERAK